MKGIEKKFQFIILSVYVLFLIVKMTGNFIPINLYLISSIAIVTAIFYSLNTLKYRKIHINKDLIALWLLIIYFALSLSWTRMIEYGINKVFILISLVMISYLFSYLIIKRTALFIKLLAIASSLTLLWYLSENGFKSIALSNQYIRLDLKEGLNPIVIARYFCFGIITYIFHLKFNNLKKIYKYLIYSLIALSLVLTFLTGSKGPILALILSFIITYAVGKRFKIKFTVKSFMILLVSLGAVFFFILPFLLDDTSSMLYQFIQRRYMGEQALNSVYSRENILNYAFTHISNEPVINLIFGNGMGDFAFSTSLAKYPHNIFVEILYECGLIGLSLFIIVIVKVVKFNYKLGMNLFKDDVIYRSLYYYYILFYFFFLAAMTSGDISGSFFVFVSLILIFKIKNYYFVSST